MPQTRWPVASSVVAIAIVAVLLLVGVARVRAEKQLERLWMSKDEILSAFVDRQLGGIYPSKKPWRELIRRDGTSDYEEAEERRAGTWWLDGDQFCFRYQTPESGGCFRVARLGTNCYELYATDRTLPDGGRGPGADLAWNGRMWREDVPATCEEKPTV